MNYYTAIFEIQKSIFYVIFRLFHAVLYTLKLSVANDFQHGDLPGGRFELQTHVDTHGHTWMHRDTLGYMWTHRETSVYKLIHMDTNCHMWTHMNTYGYLWTHIETCGNISS